MYAQDIEPVILLHAGLEECDVVVLERPEETLVANVAHTIQRKLCTAFLQQHWFDLELVCFRHLAIVVDEASHMQQVKC